MSKQLVGVYGTLRKGFHNHLLLEGARFIADAETTEACTMYSRGGFPILSFHQGSTPVKVELYEVEPHQLRRLDGLEGYRGEGQQNWYERSLKGFRYKSADGEDLSCNALIYHQDGEHQLPVVESGDWTTASRRWY